MWESVSTETKNVRTCTLLLSSAAPCECEMAYSIFANGKDPLSSVSTAISNKEDSFESANEHWSRFAAVCNLKSRNAENIRLTLTAYAPPRFYDGTNTHFLQCIEITSSTSKRNEWHANTKLYTLSVRMVASWLNAKVNQMHRDVIHRLQNESRL